MFTVLYFCCFCLVFVSAIDNITTTQFLRDPEALVSNNGIFKIGFFSPTNSTSRYVGMWYNTENSNELEIIWVANRDNPVNSSSGVLRISEDGNLQLTDGNNIIYWSSNVSRVANGSVAELLDNGNLVLRSSTRQRIIWQSTDHLTNVIFPMSHLFDQNMPQQPFLQSWKGPSDPSSGRFTMTLIPGNLPEFVIEFDGALYWRSGPWSGNHFLGVPEMSASARYGFRFIYNDNDGTVDFLYSVENTSLMAHNLLNYDGNVQQKIWDYDSQRWAIVWQSMRSNCSLYGKCGPFGACRPNDSPICSCLKGFEPRNITEWNNGIWTSGCVRRTALQCSDTGGQVDGFMRLQRMKVPNYGYSLFANDEDECRRSCLQNCSCLAYAYPTGIGCMIWNGSLIDIQELSVDSDDLFVRLAHSELGKNSKVKIFIAVIVIVATSTLVFFYCLWKWIHRRHGNEGKDQLIDYGVGPAVSKDLTLFKFKQLEGATSNFLAINKLGEGGFGPVFKGILEDGQEVAIKRLSRASGQGLQEFVNEVLVISKLQHNNLVRLLGCCVEREEKLLVYEFLPNKSLDALLFDPYHQKELDWRKRFGIIKGICRGLLYLHRDSRLKIIHRDLKASNILLDEDFNPKISDFGMARIFGTKQNQANTLRVVGTYGYMSPEYAMEGRFSEQSDVFSFGVLLLEIVSGRKNSSFFDSEYSSLLIYAWKLWNEDDMISLIDPTVFDPSFKAEILKCLLLGLLCVQEFPEDRPTISVLISMLDVDDISDLPHPKQPGFTQRQVYSTDGFSPTWQEPFTVNHLSVTVVSGR